MPTIWYRKQRPGLWRKDDGETKHHVTEDAMLGELTRLEHEGWRVNTFGITHARMIRAEK